RLEKVTLRVVGTALIVAAAYVAVRSTILLIEGVAPGRSTVGIVIAAVSVAVLPFVALAKLRLAARIPSVALRSDGVLTGAAALLAGVVLVALSLQRYDGLWWVDPAAALVIAAVLAVEGARTVMA